MEQINLFTKGENGQDEDDDNQPATPPVVPLSPMKKVEEIEHVLNQCEDTESKLIALAQLMKKDRKKNKMLNKALTKEIQKNEKLAQDLIMMGETINKMNEDLKEKDKRIVKTMADYMTTYEDLLKLK